MSGPRYTAQCHEVFFVGIQGDFVLYLFAEKQPMQTAKSIDDVTRTCVQNCA